jgi:hypothetical protein
VAVFFGGLILEFSVFEDARKNQVNLRVREKQYSQETLLTKGQQRISPRRDEILFKQDITQEAVHAMSCPQHSGDLILPCPFGHSETCTSDPSSSFSIALTSGASHSPQVALTLIPQISHL